MTDLADNEAAHMSTNYAKQMNLESPAAEASD